MTDNIQAVGLEFDTSQYERAIQRAERRLDDLEESVDRSTRDMKKQEDQFTRNARAMATYAVAAHSLRTVAQVTGDIFQLGASVEETGSKFETTFGDAERRVQAFVDTNGTLIGLSRQQAQEVLATTGAITQGLGFTTEASAAAAVEVLRLAGDLSSFNNLPTESVIRAINSALTGEREQLKSLGIVLREADVQHRALANSGKVNASALTDVERATASIELITERAGVAVGDLARTQDSAANQARRLGAEFQNVREELAVSLMPAFATGLDLTTKFTKGLQIMGAEAAVSVAQLELSFARLNEKDGGILDFLGLGKGAGLIDPLGLDLFSRAAGANLESSVAEAEANLERIRAAAEEVKAEIVGLPTASSVPLTGSSTSGGGAGTSSDPAERERALKRREDMRQRQIRSAAALAKAERDLIHNLDLEILRLTEGERAAREFELRTDGITESTIRHALARYDAIEALEAELAAREAAKEKAEAWVDAEVDRLNELESQVGRFTGHVENAFLSMEDGVVQSFGRMIDGMIKESQRLAFDRFIGGPLNNAVAGLFGDAPQGPGAIKHTIDPITHLPVGNVVVVNATQQLNLSAIDSRSGADFIRSQKAEIMGQFVEGLHESDVLRRMTRS